MINCKLLRTMSEKNDFVAVSKHIDKCKDLSAKLWECIDKNLNSYMCINEFYELDKCVHKIIYVKE